MTALAVMTDVGVNAGAAQEPRDRVPIAQVCTPRAPCDDKTLAHVLGRVTFGVRAGDVERLQRIGVTEFIDQQLHPERIDDRAFEARLQKLETLNLSTREIAEEYFLPARQARQERKREQAAQSTSPPGDTQNPPAPNAALRDPAMLKLRQVMVELDEQKLLRAIYSERQLQEGLVDFWFNHFNVFAGKGPERIMLMSYERDVIRPNVLGKFRDLLGATAHSPAMLFYLDNWLSVDPVAAARVAQRTTETRDRLNTRRRQFGFVTPRRQAPPNGQQQQPKTPRRTGLNENYARELMELHTLGVDGGYTQHDVTEVARAFTGWTIGAPRQGAGFRFDARLHDNGDKVALGHTLNAGGQKDGEQVLDILARHPSTARFISTKLARRFVSDAPPPSLIDRTARRFQDTDGDLREVVRTILTSQEFYDQSAYRAKVKNPFEFVVSAVRATNADVKHAAFLARTLQQLGMPLFMSQPPTGYADRADAWVNTGALVNRMSFAVSLADNKIPGIRLDVRSLSGKEDTASAREHLVRTLLRGDVSTATMATLTKANEITKLTALTIGAPEFQRR